MYEDLKSISAGKTVKQMSIYNGCGEDSHHLLIVFEDGSHIVIGLGFDDKDSYKLCQKHVHILTEKGKKEFEENPLRFGYVDGEGFHISSMYEDFVNAGLLTVDETIVADAIQEKKRKAEEEQYQYYLKLKEIYEGKGAN